MIDKIINIETLRTQISDQGFVVLQNVINKEVIEDIKKFWVSYIKNQS